MCCQQTLPGDPTQEARNDLLPDLILYFIAPHRFTPMDLEYIKQLNLEATVAPICAKADAMTLDERRDLQAHIQSMLAKGRASTLCSCI